MKKFVKVFLALAGFGLLAITFAPLTEHHAAASGGAPVIVQNTPLPVQGTVSVGNTASVNVANSPSVHVSNAAVSVNNALDGASNPIPLVVVQQGTPYQDTCGFSSPDCSLQAVPAHSRLVIQEVDIEVLSLPTDDVHDARFSVSTNNFGIEHFVAPINEGTNSFGEIVLVAHQATTLFADSGSQPNCSSNFSSPTVSVRCEISGYLVPAP
jgi:hypothetical protein